MAAESWQLSRILALLGGPREARGRLTAPGALRRRPPSAVAVLRVAGPRFDASLGQAELGQAEPHMGRYASGLNLTARDASRNPFAIENTF